MGPTNTDTMIVTQSRWANVRSAGASRRARIVIAALIMFLASAALVFQPDWHVATSGIHVPGLHRPSSSPSPSPSPPPPTTPAPEPEPVPIPMPAPENSGDAPDSVVQTAILSPDQDGVLLSAGSPLFSSPNGRYSLVLQPDGDLVLVHNDVSGNTVHPLWWTNTGNLVPTHNDDVGGNAAHPLWWTSSSDRQGGGRTVSIESQGGHPRLVVNASLNNNWVTVWHSDLDPKCRRNSGAAAAAREADGLLKKLPGQLELSNDGKLTLAGVCDLRVPPVEREIDRSLAVIVAGLYRTNHVTCKTHMSELIDGHPAFSRIDVFAYMLYEPADSDVHGRTKESIEAELRNCYGTHLRSVDVVPVAEAEEEYPGGKEAMLVPCGDRLRRLNNQLRTVSLAAQRWWAWSVVNGFTHDTVLRIRPDTSFWARPEFKSLEELGNSLVLPHPKGEHYFYCARMKGSVGVGPTDQIAYGTAASMQHWLHMHDRFAQMVDLAGNADRPALRDFSGCEDMPTGPLASECPRPAPCSIECLVAWYLDARGVDFRIEWGWQQNPMRWKDIGMLGAEEERMADQHQNDEDDGMRWG